MHMTANILMEDILNYYGKNNKIYNSDIESILCNSGILVCNTLDNNDNDLMYEVKNLFSRGKVKHKLLVDNLMVPLY